MQVHPTSSDVSSEWVMPGALTEDGTTHYIWRSAKAADAPIFIFIHGIGYAHFHFDGLVKALQEVWDCSCLQYDNLGMGFSRFPSAVDARSKRTWDGHGHVKQLCNLLQSLGLIEQIEPPESLRRKKLVLVGHSMGAAISALFAQEHSELIAGLVLLSPVGLMNMPVKWWLLRKLVRHIPVYRDRNKRRREKGKFRIESVKKFGDFVDVECEASNRTARSIVLMHRNNNEAYDAFWKCLCHFPLNSLKRTAIALAATNSNKKPFPVLLLAGEKDATTPVSSNFNRWASIFHTHPAFSGQVVAGAHAFFLEFPDTTLHILSEWIRSHNLAQIKTAPSGPTHNKFEPVPAAPGPTQAEKKRRRVVNRQHLLNLSSPSNNNSDI